MSWYCTSKTRGFAHSPSLPKAISPTIVLNEGRQIPAERVDALARGLGLIFLEEIQDPGELHTGGRQPKILVDNAVTAPPRETQQSMLLANGRFLMRGRRL